MKRKEAAEAELSGLEKSRIDCDNFLVMAEEYADIPALDREFFYNEINPLRDL